MHKPIKDRLVPYKILAYLLYSGPRPWLEPLGGGRVRLRTGDASRHFRLKSSVLWEALYWLEKHKMLQGVQKERKRGTVILVLQASDNLSAAEAFPPLSPGGSREWP